MADAGAAVLGGPVLETGAEEGEDEVAAGFELGAGTGDGIGSAGRCGVEGAECVECIDCCCAIGCAGLPNCVLIATCRPFFTCGDGPAMSADVGGASSAGVRFVNVSDDCAATEADAEALACLAGAVFSGCRVFELCGSSCRCTPLPPALLLLLPSLASGNESSSLLFSGDCCDSR